MKNYTINDLVMKRPASVYLRRWYDSTPIGTGITGAMFYGGVSDEHIIINRSDFWFGGKDAHVPDVSKYLDEMRALRKLGKYAEANDIMYDALIRNNYATELADMRTLGCLKISFPCSGVYNNYRRIIHMDTSEAEVSYKIDDDSFKRRYIASRVRDIIAIEIDSEQKIDFGIKSGFFQSFDGGKEDELRENDAKTAEYSVKDNCYIYSAENEGKFFGIACKVITDGTAEAEINGIGVKHSTNTLVLIKAFSGENNRKEGEDKAILALCSCPESYAEIFEENLHSYQQLYNNADICLYEGNEFHSNEELMINAKDTKLTPELTEKLWRFGRYLFISGTSQTALPFPLYGIWVGGYNCQFTHHVANENVQSIYWHTLSGGLSELTKALIDYYYNRIETYRENARNLFGCRGIFVGTYTTPVNAAVAWYVPVILHFIGVAGWLSQHFYNYYLHTKDEELFENKILPFMIEAAEFYEDYYYQDEDGNFILYPAVSPENSPMEYRDSSKPHSMPVTENPTVEIAILKELLTNLIYVSKTRPQLSKKAEIWKEILDKIPPYWINEDGAVAEWISDVHTDVYLHRHISHLYPVFPGTEVNIENNEEMMPYFKKALDLREKGWFCGWTLPHMAAVYSRFEDSENVFYHMNAMTKVCLLDNFFTTVHDFRDMGITGNEFANETNMSVQFDALMGFVNVTQEMLIYTAPEIVKILPACPKEYNAGKARLHFFDGTAEISWNIDKEEYHGVLTASRDTKFNLYLPFGEKKRTVILQAGEKIEF